MWCSAWWCRRCRIYHYVAAPKLCHLVWYLSHKKPHSWSLLWICLLSLAAVCPFPPPPSLASVNSGSNHKGQVKGTVASHWDIGELYSQKISITVYVWLAATLHRCELFLSAECWSKSVLSLYIHCIYLCGSSLYLPSALQMERQTSYCSKGRRKWMPGALPFHEEDAMSFDNL